MGDFIPLTKSHEMQEDIPIMCGCDAEASAMSLYENRFS